MRKQSICICQNKDADQLRGNHEADQRLCFRYTESTVPLLLKSKILSFYPASVTVQPDLCQTSSETTLLVFPPDGSNNRRHRDRYNKIESHSRHLTGMQVQHVHVTSQNITKSIKSKRYSSFPKR